ncbi:hypothetical protein [Leptolyngbya sp. FACHB-16]|uniref:hypothetical protein n=1 Tax=unclassified Leptolyngbya TaxID=2650499 RepID=UPI0016868289|nr:hypothetical protein [Leptolyngbya sp. FACHB-16]MBD1911636.1 hypothetical protein [Leptolyngbya sp. FACHB-8]MBD2153201.1 hypothetical protein [Leptolyngbya sp. FACHB-16]
MPISEAFYPQDLHNGIGETPLSGIESLPLWSGIIDLAEWPHSPSMPIGWAAQELSHSVGFQQIMLLLSSGRSLPHPGFECDNARAWLRQSNV